METKPQTAAGQTTSVKFDAVVGGSIEPALDRARDKDVAVRVKVNAIDHRHRVRERDNELDFWCNDQTQHINTYIVLPMGNPQGYKSPAAFSQSHI